MAGDTNGVLDVFVRDRAAGTTTRVSVSSTGAQGNAQSGRFFPVSVSGDGRFVAFESAASNLVAGDTNGLSDVFVHDRQTGATTREAVDGTDPVLNDDGRFLAYGAAGRVFVRDRQLGTTEQLPTGTNTTAQEPDLSGDGRFVALTITRADFGTDVWVYDRTDQLIDRLTYEDDYAYAPQISDDGTVVVFGNSGGDEALIVEGGQVTSIPGGPDYRPDISDDGRYVTFRSESRNLVEGDTNGEDDVFLLDRTTQVITRVSVGSDGQQGDESSDRGVIGGDGRYIAFDSAASNLVAGDTNGAADVFVRDRGEQTTGVAG